MRRSVLITLIGAATFAGGFLAGRQMQPAHELGEERVANAAVSAVQREPAADTFYKAGIASGHSLSDLIAMPAEELERCDPIEIDLAVASSIPGQESLDVPRYQRIVDGWAGQVRLETERYLCRFQASPGEYKNSEAYFRALVMATVIGQDLQVGYDLESVAFDDPRDLFVHGVIDDRRGTCVSLPVLYLAIGHRLGYPIRAVSVPRHIFCRWDDPATGERFNIEAAGAGGLVDHPDEYYMTWPAPCDKRDVEAGGALKTLTMREFLGLKLATRGDYYWHQGRRPEAQVSYALAHQLCPSNRSIFEILATQVLAESERYPWSPIHRLASRDPVQQRESSRSVSEQKGLP